MSSPDAQALNWHYTELSDRDFEIQGRTLFFIAVLFSIMLLVALLILYVRWICGYQGQLPSNFGTGQARPAQPLPPPPPPPLQGLDPVSIKKLPIILHQTPSDPMCALEATECCICLGPFKDSDKLKVLPGCDHSFHSECVDKWLASHSSCPLCRASLKVDFSFPKILIQEPPVRI